MSTFETILIAYIFLGCAYWLWTAVGVIRTVRAVPLLADLNPPQPESWPRLSIIIPACNEAQTMEAAVSSILRQDYPDMEIILVDDRSTDGTGEIVDRIAASDDRVRPLHITHLPERWLGKVHALHRGIEQADGRWLLFTDADIHFSDDALRRTVAYCEQRGLDHLATVPEMWPATFLVDVTVDMFFRILCIGMRCWAIEDPRSKAYIGIGAFNLVRRSAFENTEGFQWLRLEVADDVGLGMMLKRSGARCCLVNAAGFIGLCWYGSAAEMARGAEKGFASIARCRIWLLLAVCLCMIALELSPLAALAALHNPGLVPAGLATITSALLSVVILHRWANRPIFHGLCFPLAVAFSVALLLRAGWLGLLRGGIVWRGTLYPSKILREGLRVRFP